MIVFEKEDWVKNASCRTFPSELFFPVDKADYLNAPAIDICVQCPVRKKCLDSALRRKEEYGIWGGTIPSERKYIRRNKMLPEEYLNIRCGTPDGFKKHSRIGEEICQSCRTAKTHSDAAKKGHGEKI